MNALLINLLFLFTFRLLDQLRVQRTLQSEPPSWITWIFTSFAIILCMSFPSVITEEYFFDLRQIPIWLGSLYGGPIVGGGLWLVTVIYRAILGGTGVYTAMAVAGVQVIIGALIYPYFKKWSSHQRVVIAVLLALLSGLFSLVFIRVFSDISLGTNIWIPSIVIQGAGMWLLVHTAEVNRKNQYLMTKVVQTEKLEVVSHLASSIAHEIRNPMTTTRGFIQLLEQTDSIPRNKQKEFLTLAREELDRAEVIIRDYLTFAKPAPEQIESLCIIEETERAINMLRPMANMSAVHIYTDLQPFTFKGDKLYFRQALVNIIKNAIEAMPNGGDLTFFSKLESDYGVLTIIDTGQGMSKVQCERLGEPFFTTKEQKGTGLGMMVTYRIIQSIGGTIKVKSDLGKGTSFTLRILAINTESYEHDDEQHSKSTTVSVS